LVEKQPKVGRLDGMVNCTQRGHNQKVFLLFFILSFFPHSIWWHNNKMIVRQKHSNTERK
jgi:hypothetical protein